MDNTSTIEISSSSENDDQYADISSSITDYPIRNPITLFSILKRTSTDKFLIRKTIFYKSDLMALFHLGAG